MDVKDMTYDDARRIVEEARRYVFSPGGRRELKKALERADKSSRQMREAARVTKEGREFCVDI